jgi:hypothetical protein
VHERRLAAVVRPLAGLIRMLLLGLDVAETDLAPVDAELLVALGIADEVSGVLRPRVRIVPHDDLLIACDLSERKDADHVAGVHRPSVALAALTVRRPVATALDVGTGNGVQAILASRHAQRVVGTDINERALAFAEFSAALNGAMNIEFRPGSFFEPVEGERFDLVVSIRRTSSHRRPRSSSATAASRETPSAPTSSPNSPVTLRRVASGPPWSAGSPVTTRRNVHASGLTAPVAMPG